MAKRIDPKVQTFANIKVVGVGGAGGSAINRMIDSGISDIEFIVINTDAQALSNNKAETKLHIGPNTTRGLGAGGDPKVGQEAAQESIEEIKKVIDGSDMIFLTLGAGGGTGSGAAHVIAKAAKELGILVVAFATKPFHFEVDRRSRNSDFALTNLEKHVDTLVVIPNDNLLKIINQDTPIQEAFQIADDVLKQGVKGIAELITVNGLINLDFADVCAIMKDAGQALMGIGRASGENRAEIAARQAVSSPLLDLSINGAKGVLFNISGSNDLTMHEVNRAAQVITEVADQEVNVIFGATINPELEGEVVVTVVATGFDKEAVIFNPQPIVNPLNNDYEEDKSINNKESDTEDDSEDEDLSPVTTDNLKDKEEKIDDLLDEIENADISDEDDDSEDDLDDDDEDEANLWDDVETDKDDEIDINKPTIIRQLLNRRRKRKQEKDEDLDDEDK